MLTIDLILNEMATSAGEEAVVESEVQVVGTPTTDGEGQLPGTSESIAPISAVVIGGTGATGRCLVGLLLKDKVHKLLYGFFNIG